MSANRSLDHPVFGQPQPTPDPTKFRIEHASDSAAYAEIDQLNKSHGLNAMPFPPPRDLPEPTLTLEQVLGGDAQTIKNINDHGQIVFHSGGDCGSTRGPKTESEVADKMVSDFNESDLKEIPQFHLLLGEHHHPIYTHGRHCWSIEMGAQIDEICSSTGVWPHAVLAGHAHNYQRFTRTRPDGSQIPYLVCGNTGHNVQKLARGAPLRSPQVIQKASKDKDQVSLENYDDANYGYLRLTADPKRLRIEYHPASDGPSQKTPDDFVTVDLKSRQLIHWEASDLGQPAEADEIATWAKDHPPIWLKKRARHATH